ncbi:unnamed protein product [Adineta steineri]|uniref:Uncharacterized protein n=2 Tax=Adineta steineri TaxID=433720 RepID=A0A815L1C8_9BILA|nr:unnamed protein product [Adineta steineri]
MCLSSDDEHNLQQILMDMKNEIGDGETNLCILGTVVRRMGHFDLAKKYYYRCLDELSQNDPLILTVYKDLAEIASQQKDYEEYLRLRQILAKIKEKIQLNDNEIETSEIDKLTYNGTIQKRKSKTYIQCNWHLKLLICSFILILMIGIGMFTLRYMITKHSSKSSEEQKWTMTGNMSIGRYGHTASTLANELVLVSGGQNDSGSYLKSGRYVNSAELYNPSTGAWTTTGSMNDTRAYHTASILANGLVLVAGGSVITTDDYEGDVLETVELYNASTGIWTTTGSMNVGRGYHTASILSNGLVLVSGGAGNSFGFLTSAELYNPSTGTWTFTANMNTGRRSHTASTLANGLVLVTGGELNNHHFNSAELYNLSTGTWTTTGSMNFPRRYYTASTLANGSVLVTGGEHNNRYVNSAELYNPSTGTWTTTGSMNVGRGYHTASTLANGYVLVAGGDSSIIGDYVNSTELYNPSAGTWTATRSVSVARSRHVASILANGKVLVTGGLGNSGILNSTELY